MRRRFPSTAGAISIATGLVLCVALGACTQPSVVFEPTDASLDAKSARALLVGTDTSALAKREVADAAKLRHDALVELRSNGEDASKVATLITRTFPADTRAVPVRVQTAVWQDRPAVVLIEAYGSASGRLGQKRLWVLDRATGNVLLAASKR